VTTDADEPDAADSSGAPNLPLGGTPVTSEAPDPTNTGIDTDNPVGDLLGNVFGIGG
jgi:hypothetical protein